MVNVCERKSATNRYQVPPVGHQRRADQLFIPNKHNQTPKCSLESLDLLVACIRRLYKQHGHPARVTVTELYCLGKGCR